MTPGDLLSEWGAAWTARDADLRRKHLEACCTEDVEFVPPDERPTVRGRENLLAHLADYTSGWPADVGFALVSQVEAHHDWCRAVVRWTFPSRTADGLDLVRIEDGRIATMVVFKEGSTDR